MDHSRFDVGFWEIVRAEFSQSFRRVRDVEGDDSRCEREIAINQTARCGNAC